VAKKRKHLSTAHRRAIAKGLHRYWRQVRAQRAKRARQARARRALRKVQKALAGRKPRTEEWELTMRYDPKRRRQAVGWTTRIVAPVGTSREVVMIVARRAGVSVEKGFCVEIVNWQKPLEAARPKEYAGGSPEDVTGWMGLMAKGTVVRLERVRE